MIQLDDIEGTIRIESHPRPVATPLMLDRLRSVYPHDQIFGDFCTVQGYVNAPPDELYDWLSDTRSLEEWTYSLRGFSETDEAGLWVAQDRWATRPTSTRAPSPTRTPGPWITTAPGTRANTCG